MAQAQRKARVTVVGTSHIRRLRDALDSATDKRMEANFGVSQVDINYVCGGGWTLDSVCARQATITESRPDFILIKAGSNDLAQVELVDSIKVANQLIELARSLCISSGARSAIICELTQRSVGRYLRSPHQVQIYNERIRLANRFLREVLSLEPNLIFWRHKAMSASVEHLVCRDGTHFNALGQYLLYKSIRGAIIYAAKSAGLSSPK